MAREADVAPRFGQRIQVNPEFRHRSRRIRDAAARQVADHGHQQTGKRDPDRIAPHPGEQAAGQRADEDGDEGPRLDQRVAADKFVLDEMLRQDRVLDRSEDRRLQAEQAQRGKQHGEAVQVETEHGDAHDHDLEDLRDPRQQRLVVLVGQLPGGRREEEERQDEDAASQVGQDFRRQRRPARRVEGEQDNECVLVEIVVEGAEELRHEERCKTPGLEQPHLRMRVCGCLRSRFGSHRAPSGDRRSRKRRRKDGCPRRSRIARRPAANRSPREFRREKTISNGV